MMTEKKYKTAILTIEEVASWWLPTQLKEINPDVKAQLPTLQRGFVWKPAQVERLWDSLLQGFPIGSLLLSPVCGENITKAGKYSDGEIEEPTHILLDGQQRVTSITLGFRSAWLNKDPELRASLWVDLKPSERSDRHFDFRMITKSHPWGYKQKDSKKTISSSRAADALAVFRELLDDKSIKPHDLALENAFPWDATAPVPVSFLISAIQESQSDSDSKLDTKAVAESLLKKLKNIPLYSYDVPDAGTSKVLGRIKKRQKECEERINTEGAGFCKLVLAMSNTLEHAEIPAPVVEHLSKVKGGSKKDPVYTLFERINNAGTNLSVEEINYSQLKVVWPNAPAVIEDKILKKCHIAKPARLVSVLTRLFLMDGSNMSSDKRIPSDHNIKEFGDFLDNNRVKFEIFCEKEGPGIVEKTWKFLTEHENGLPKVLAAEVAKKSSDLMLLIMLWVSHVNSEHVASQNNCRERTLGFFTAIAWFSSNAKGIEKCAKKLANDLHGEMKSKEDITEFFDSGRFNSLFCDKDSLLLMPLPKPEEVTDALKTMILDNMDSGAIWKQGWWEQIKGPEPKIVSYFNRIINAGDDNGVAEQLWSKFFEKIYRDRRFLLYSQRGFIEKNFDWFNPILPDQKEDRNRPWDYDHILPYSWTQSPSGNSIRNQPRLVSTWVQANGNFRAWPYELNRSKGNEFIFEDNAPTYGLNSEKDVIEASFVKNIDEWQSIQKLKKLEFQKEKGGEIQQRFIRASINRTVDIYEEWYEKLHVGDLMASEK